MALVTARDLRTFQRNTRWVASGCLIWTGPTDSSGYGVIATSNGPMPVHRFSYLAHKGPVPAGLQVDHVCHTEAVKRGECSGDRERCPHRRCANPAHLEAVTASENTKRQDHANRRKNVCAKGHDLTDPANVHLRPSGRRACRACDRERKH